MAIKLGVQPVEEIKQKAKLPDPTVETSVANDGASFSVLLTFPLPEDDQVLETIRYKKDNKDEVSSTTRVIGLAKGIPLTFAHEGKQVGLIDEQGNQVYLFVAKCGTKTGSGEDDDATAE